jgi:hypothetical protein
VRLTALDELDQAQQSWSSYQILDCTYYHYRQLYVENEQVALTTNGYDDPVDDSFSGFVIPEVFPILANRILDGVQAIDITSHEEDGYSTIFRLIMTQKSHLPNDDI